MSVYISEYDGSRFGYEEERDSYDLSYEMSTVISILVTDGAVRKTFIQSNLLKMRFENITSMYSVRNQNDGSG